MNGRDDTNAGLINGYTVRASVGKLNTAYNDINNVLVNIVKSKFTDKMARVWGSEEAQKYFNQIFKTNMEGLGKGADKTYQSVVDTMETEATTWLQNEDSSYAKVGFQQKPTAVDVSQVQTQVPNQNGFKGISDYNSFIECLNTLRGEIKNLCDQALDQSVNAVNNSGWVAGNTQSQLTGSLKKIKTEIANKFEEIIAEAQKTTDAVKAKHEQMTKSTESAFTVK